jgi:hypothetical protein
MYFYDYTIAQEGRPEKHLKSAWAVVPGEAITAHILRHIVSRTWRHGLAIVLMRSLCSHALRETWAATRAHLSSTRHRPVRCACATERCTPISAARGADADAWRALVFCPLARTPPPQGSVL